MTATAAELKACCAASYTGEAARFLLGDSFHPGGAELTSRLLGELDAGAGTTILDLASGRGTSAILAARQLGCNVVGVELAPANVADATSAAADAGVADAVRFVHADAERLPLPDRSMDGALCECSFCLFPDKPSAAAELARVLRAGAVVAISDVTAVPERLPTELAGVAAWAACIADARPLAEVAALLEDAGLAVERTEAVDGVLEPLLDRIEARLRLARIVRDSLPPDLVENVVRGLELARAARSAVADGALGYGIVVARR